MPPSFTTRLALSKPDEDDQYDISIPNGNVDILDTIAGVRRVTSNTRPATPYVEQLIIETDTGRIMSWDGDSWEIVFTPPTIPTVFPTLIGGERYDGADNTLTTLAVNGTEQLTGMDSGTVSLEANTSYYVKTVVSWDGTVAADRFDFRLRQTNVSGTQVGVKQNVLFQTAAVREQLYLEGLWHQGGSAGSNTFVLTMQRRSGTGGGLIYRSTVTRPFVIVERAGLTSAITQI